MMVMKNTKVALSAALVSGAFLFSACASAEDAAIAQARAEMVETVANATKMFERGASAEEFVDAVYTDDVVMMGGTPGAKVGKAAILAEVKKWFVSLGPDGIKACKYVMKEPAEVTATTYSSFFVVHCEPNPPHTKAVAEFSELYVWKKTPAGWRISQEMWVDGGF